MRETKTETGMTLESVVGLGSSVNSSLTSRDEVSALNMPYNYNEMADVPVQIVDPVEQVEKNLLHLQELQHRMRFMMREIRYLMKM